MKLPCPNSNLQESRESAEFLNLCEKNRLDFRKLFWISGFLSGINLMFSLIGFYVILFSKFVDLGLASEGGRFLFCIEIYGGEHCDKSLRKDSVGYSLKKARKLNENFEN